MSEGKQSKGFQIFQYVLLALMLIVFPAGSWYYLNQGFDYRKTVMEELQVKDSLPELQFIDYTGKILTNKEIEGNLIVAVFLSSKKGIGEAVIEERIAKLYDQFDKRSDFNLFIHLTGLDSAAFQTQSAALLDRLELEDPSRCFILEGSEKIALSEYKIPLGTTALDDANWAVLIDENQYIRNFYQLDEEENVKTMVQHIALSLPKQKEKDLIFKRDAEK